MKEKIKKLYKVLNHGNLTPTQRVRLENSLRCLEYKYFYELSKNHGFNYLEKSCKKYEECY